MNLTELANRFRSDKGTVHGNPPHRYSHLYDLLFAPYRNQSIRFPEMGLAIGGPELGGPIDRQVNSPSISIWLEYFPNAQIYGFDISDFSHMVHPHFTFTRSDSGIKADLQKLANVSLHLDIIIDDAFHASYHQQLALKLLYPKLAAGGFYVVEDLYWQAMPFGTMLPKVPKTAELLNCWFEEGHYLENDLLSKDELVEMKRTTGSFASFPTFGRGTSSRQAARSGPAPLKPRSRHWK